MLRTLHGLRRRGPGRNPQLTREDEVLEEAVRRYLIADARRSSSLIDLFERIDHGQEERGVEPLSDEEAMQLANDELHAWRNEQARELP